jgi:hypothetical protein
MKEAMELLILICSRVEIDCRRHLKSVLHQLTFIITRILKREIPPELEQLTECAEYLRTMLQDGEDLSQSRCTPS